MPADSIILCLQHLTDYRQFERLCSDIMLGIGYKSIEPLGGPSDRGRDALHVGRDSPNSMTIFAYSVRKDWRQKLDEDCKRIREEGHALDRLVFVCTSEISSTQKDNAKRDVREKYSWELEIYDVERLRVHLAGDLEKLVDKHGSIFCPPWFPKRQRSLALSIALLMVVAIVVMCRTYWVSAERDRAAARKKLRDSEQAVLELAVQKPGDYLTEALVIIKTRVENQTADETDWEKVRTYVTNVQVHLERYQKYTSSLIEQFDSLTQNPTLPLSREQLMIYYNFLKSNPKIKDSPIGRWVQAAPGILIDLRGATKNGLSAIETIKNWRQSDFIDFDKSHVKAFEDRLKALDANLKKQGPTAEVRWEALEVFADANRQFAANEKDLKSISESMPDFVRAASAMVIDRSNGSTHLQDIKKAWETLDVAAKDCQLPEIRLIRVEVEAIRTFLEGVCRGRR